MTVSSTNNQNRYQGNAVTDTFAFTGRIFNTSDLVVQILTRSTDVVVETLTETTHYTVTINSDESASVQVVGAKIPSAVQDILIYRDLTQTQTVNLPTGTRFPALNVENALDKLTAIVQDLSEELDRTLTVPINSSGSAISISGSLTADTLLQVDSTGNEIESSDVTASEVSALSAIAADITTVAGIDSDVTAVAGDATDIGTVAASITNVNTVAGSIANVNTVAGGVTNINTVAGDIANVNIVATNITGVNSFAARYRVGATDPVSDNDEGDLFYNTTSDLMKYYNGAAWEAIEPGITSSDNVTWTGDHTFSGNFQVGAGGATIDIIRDENDMASDDANALPTQKSVKAYVDANAGGGGWIPLQTQTVSSPVASVDFTTGIDSTYKAYVIVGKVVVTADEGYFVRTSNDGGSTYDSGASDYMRTYYAFDGASFAGGTNSQTGDNITVNPGGSVGSAAGESAAIVMFLFDPSDATKETLIDIESTYVSTTGNLGKTMLSAKRSAAEAVNAVRLATFSSTFAAGTTFTLYGIASA